MRRGTLRVGGGELETAWWGPGPAEAPTLVLLHEGLGCVDLWRDVPERLAASTGWGVFAYSRFGYGRSDGTPLPRPVTYMHREALEVLPQVLDAAGIRRSVLIGHSDGGSIAAIYAGSDPTGADFVANSADSLSTVMPTQVGIHAFAAASTVKGFHGLPSQAMTVREQSARAGTDSTSMVSVHLAGLITIAAHFFVEDVNIASIERIKTDYEIGDLRDRLARYHNDVDTAFYGWNGAWLNPDFRAFDITGYLPAIQAPILALQGADDPYGTDEQLRVFEARVRAPITIELIAGARHSPHLEAKDATVAAITRFITDLSP